jgi:hypothetical protein
MRDLKDIAADTQRFRDAVRAVHAAITEPTSPLTDGTIKRRQRGA